MDFNFGCVEFEVFVGYLIGDVKEIEFNIVFIWEELQNYRCGYIDERYYLERVYLFLF